MQAPVSEPTAPDIGEFCGEVWLFFPQIWAVIPPSLSLRDISPRGETGKQKPVVEVAICGQGLGEWNAVFPQIFRKFASDQVA